MTKSQKLIASFVSAALALSVAAVSGTAKNTVSADTTESGFIYTVSNGKVTITGYSGTDSEVAIPDNINGLPVTNIKSLAFSNKDGIEYLSIPETVTDIGTKAFYDCDGLLSVIIPSSVTTIGENCFKDCGNLEKAELRNGYAGNSMFYNCDNLTEVVLSDDLTQIRTYAFSNCDNLSQIKIPDKVNEIQSGAFSETALKEIVFPDSLAKVSGGTGAAGIFANCVSLEKVTFGKNLTSIASGMFSNCDSLTEVIIPDSVTSIGNNAFDGADSLASVVIGSAVSSVGDYAFRNCASLKSVTVKGPVTTVGSYAFSNCDSLTEIEFPDSLSTIKSYAFDNCDSLEKAELGNSISTIGNYAFQYCMSLKSIDLKGPLSSMGTHIFQNDDNLESAVFSDKATVTGKYTFFNCDGLKNVVLGSSITSIDDGAFQNCLGIKEIVFPENLKSIGSGSFRGCVGLRAVDIPDSVTTVGSYSFYNDDALQKLVIGKGVTSIGNYAFCDCDAVKEVVIPDSVTTIGAYAFDSCDSLASVKTGENLKSIESYAFTNNKSLSSLELGKNLVSIGDGAFKGNISLRSLVIPDKVTKTGSETFKDCTSLSDVYIGKSLVSLSSGVFRNCDALKSIVIGESVTSIGTYAFYSCDVLNDVYIPDSVTTISNYSFNYVPALTEIYIPDSVVKIETNAFDRKNVTLKGNEDSYVKTYAENNGIAFEAASAPVLAPEIIRQPVNVAADEGRYAEFKVSASGKDIRYQWYWRKNANEAWAASSGTGYNTDTLTVAATTARNGYQYYCKITDANGNTVDSAVAALKVNAALAVTAQPVSKTVTEGTTAKFTVTASGTGLKYQWYWRKNSSEAWAASSGTGYNTNTLSVAGETKRNGYQYYCRITDASGNTVKTSTVTLTVKAALAVTTQPVNKTVTEGTTAKFTVAASGTGLKYQWYWRKTSADTWTASSGTGYNTATLSVAGETKRNGYQYYCKITDASGNTVKTNTVTLTVKAAASTALSITSQPVSKTVSEGTTVKFTVAASGTGLKYQWYWKKPTAVDWTASTGTGYNTSSLTVEATKARNEYQYYCKITDASGRTVKSSAATLNVSSAVLAVVTQPVSQTAAVGQSVKFTVKATGDGLKYQWYWKRPTDTDWTASTGTGYNTSSLSVTGSETRNGYQYYCKITDASGKSVKTQAATLKVK